MNLRSTRLSLGYQHISGVAQANPSAIRNPKLLRLHRAYATTSTSKRDPTYTSSLLSHSLDQQRAGSRQRDSVGPFQLGLIPPTPRDGGNTKKWSELSASGKVWRSTARLSNLAVIVVGGGLFTVLVYALTSELFSKNSATVLYGQACDLIKSSPKITQYFKGPLIFHNNPPSAGRPRHRNDRVMSQPGRDAQGRETLLLTFFLEAKRPSGSLVDEDQSLWESASQWTSQKVEALSNMSVEDVWQHTEEYASEKWEAARRLFRFLSGDSVQTTRSPLPAVTPEVKQVKENGGWTSSITGLFAGLRGAGREHGESPANVDSGEVYSEGEVHAFLVMNDSREFEFRYLRVDVPDSHSPSKRIYVIPPNGPGNGRWI